MKVIKGGETNFKMVEREELERWYRNMDATLQRESVEREKKRRLREESGGGKARWNEVCLKYKTRGGM